MQLCEHKKVCEGRAAYMVMWAVAVAKINRLV